MPSPKTTNILVHNSEELKSYLNNSFDEYIPDFDGTLELFVSEKENLIKELQKFKNNEDFEKLESKIKEIIIERKKGELNLYSKSISSLTGLSISQNGFDENSEDVDENIDSIEIDSNQFYFWIKGKKFAVGKYYLNNAINNRINYLSSKKINYQRQKELNNLKKLRFLLYKAKLNSLEKFKFKNFLTMFFLNEPLFLSQLSPVGFENLNNITLREKLKQTQENIIDKLVHYNHDIEELRKMKIKIARKGEERLMIDLKTTGKLNQKLKENTIRKIRQIDNEIISKGIGIVAILKDTINQTNFIILKIELQKNEKIQIGEIFLNQLKGFGITEDKGKIKISGYMGGTIYRNSKKYINDNFGDFAETGLGYLPITTEVLDYKITDQSSKNKNFGNVGNLIDVINLISANSSQFSKNLIKFSKKSLNSNYSENCPNIANILKKSKKVKKSKFFKEFKEGIFLLGESKNKLEKISYIDNKGKVLTFKTLGIAILDWFGDINGYLKVR